MTANLRLAAGSLMVVGLAGTELTGLERAQLKLIRPAGVILFRRNIADARQTCALLHEATAQCALRPLRCVDVEGGTVNRLRDALAPMPSAQAVTRKALDPTLARRLEPTRKNGAPIDKSLMREHGELIARAVKAFGFNVTLAPLLDIGFAAYAGVIGPRCAAPEAEGVTEYAKAFLAGLTEHKVTGCGKHFPGLGGGMLDSHIETPTIRRSFRELWNEDLAPYRKLRHQLPMVMVNHAAYPGTPGRNRPASVSSFWIGEVLRKRIGFRGLIVSDDLEMGGILKFMPIEDAAIESIRAGMDLVEICHSPERILRAYESLVREAESSRAFRTLLISRARQAEKKREKLVPFAKPAALSPARLEALRDRILRFGETIGGLPANSQTIPTRAETA
jgi:beta-N-acetylhexosaminidase